MDKLNITGGTPLNGEILVSKAKNAYLPIIAGALLNPEQVIFNHLPQLRDIDTIMKLLSNLGVNITWKERTATLDTSSVDNYSATYDLVKTMRASILVLGPLLARFKKARVSLPGGCAIGARPIDIHLQNLEKMGANIDLKDGYVEASTDGLVGTELVLRFPSVGATENIMMAATLAKGKTVIENTALEPEIEDLGNFLNAMGAKVSGHGTSVITIEGVEKLHAVEYTAIGDRIEAATYVMAGLASQGNLKVSGFNPQHIEAVLSVLKEMGAKLEVSEDSVSVAPSQLKAATIETAPYPGFPTDCQAQMTALLSLSEGTSLVTENVFENRFMHVPELVRMGARIDLKGKSAVIKGKCDLSSAPVMCTDLRASAALIIAGCAAQGTTEIQRIYHLDRGYELLDQKLKTVGASVERIR